MRRKALKPVWYLLLVPSLLLLVGCSGNSTEPDPPDLRYGREMKRQTLEFVQGAKRNPRSAAQGASNLLEVVEGYQQHNVGVHKEIFSRIEEKCKEIQADVQASRWAEIDKKLTELEDLANKLPGEVKLATPESE